MPAGESERMLSLSEAARRSGVSASRLRRLAAAGTLRAQKAGTYPGEMEVRRDSVCEPGCGYEALTATCSDLSGNLDPRLAGEGTPGTD
jgi:hypothetical protein